MDDPDLSGLLHVAATTETRAGELCGLRCQSVDLDVQAVAICDPWLKVAEALLLKRTPRCMPPGILPWTLLGPTC
jgi:hypothetical protein